ncbi:MAG: YggU family protein [Syntrophobacteraceae bacterium]|nr:YggU family protein [Syntrophobacteraceae bacterium]
MSALLVKENREGTVIQVLVQPKASKNELAGVRDGVLRVRLTAPPVEGQANEACLRYLAGLLRVSRSSMDILHGHKSRRKTLLVRGLPPEAVQKLLTGESSTT